MILIFSYVGDLTTDFVIDWLNHYKYPVFRLNSSDFYNKTLRVDLQNQKIYLDEQEVPTHEIHAIWFRKFGLKKDFELFKNRETEIAVCLNLHEEHLALFKTICYILKDKNWLTDPELSELNKCTILLKATDVGLDVPQTYVLNSQKDVLRILEKDDYITKSLFNPSFIKKDEGIYSMYTKRITENILTENNLPSIFSASLMQKRIEKEYELRVFYINGAMYSMAILSQNDAQTIDDFRNYNWLKPNRTIPYNLPNEIKIKIKKLMRNVGLNCGSLDFIKSTDGHYYFLEINPVGQFGMIDFQCNYGLHQKVALELIKMDKSQ